MVHDSASTSPSMPPPLPLFVSSALTTLPFQKCRCPHHHASRPHHRAMIAPPSHVSLLLYHSPQSSLGEGDKGGWEGRGGARRTCPPAHITSSQSPSSLALPSTILQPAAGAQPAHSLVPLSAS